MDLWGMEEGSMGGPRKSNGVVTGIGERIKKRRKEMGLTQAQLAKGCAISRNLIGVWETNDGNLTTTTLMELCRVLEISSDELLGIPKKRSRIQTLIQHRNGKQSVGNHKKLNPRQMGLIEKYRGFAHHVAKEMQNGFSKPFPLDDMTSVALETLCDLAIEYEDKEIKESFTAIADIAIRRKIVSAYYETWSHVKLTEHSRRLLKAYKGTYRRLYRENQKAPRFYEVLELLQLSERQKETLVSALKAIKMNQLPQQS